VELQRLAGYALTDDWIRPITWLFRARWMVRVSRVAWLNAFRKVFVVDPIGLDKFELTNYVRHDGDEVQPSLLTVILLCFRR
jgi:hypothetical protein